MDQEQPLHGGLYLAVFNVLILLFAVSYYQSIFTPPGSPSSVCVVLYSSHDNRFHLNRMGNLWDYHTQHYPPSLPLPALATIITESTTVNTSYYHTVSKPKPRPYTIGLGRQSVFLCFRDISHCSFISTFSTGSSKL
ncbi:hypothetical protein BGZ92_004120 [Podila epicladia]|nr:hypothetical protein BGZ92_004120 [Podila epicladia]